MLTPGKLLTKRTIVFFSRGNLEIVMTKCKILLG